MNSLVKSVPTNSLANSGSKNKPHTNRNKNYCSYFRQPPSVQIEKHSIPKDLLDVLSNNLQPWDGMSQKAKRFLDIILKLISAKGDRSIVNKNNHLQILKLLLYLEEYQNQVDMKRYDRNDVKFERWSTHKSLFKMDLDNLTEQGLVVKPRDFIEIIDQNSNVLYTFEVTNVMDDKIIFWASEKFIKEYSNDKLYIVRFKLNNYTYGCDHLALKLINYFELTPLLFPIKRQTFCAPSSEKIWFNKNIESNPEQKQAVINIVNKSSYPAPYILYGPPGTGKTATLVETICQIWLTDPSSHVLICTPSNSAADVITKRLVQYIPENDIYRMFSPSRETAAIDNDILKCSNFIDGEVIMLPKEIVVMKKIVIATLCACIRLLFLNLKEKHFSYVFIDEAGQAIEPTSLIPFNLLSSDNEGRIGKLHGQIVIAGDPMQLGPGIRSKIAEPLLGTSMLERLMLLEPYKKNDKHEYNSNYITKLVRNYRSHEKIIEVSNKLFYENELIPCAGSKVRKAESWAKLPKPGCPIFFHGVRGKEVKEDPSPSSFNEEEVAIVVSYVSQLVGKRFGNHKIKQEDIGIITPFLAQKKKIVQALQNKSWYDVSVGTVESFQGQEREVILYSTVRSKKFFHDNKCHIGFLSNYKRFNVALTRAMSLCICIGNSEVLQVDESWRHFIEFCWKNNSFCGTFNYNIKKSYLDKTSDTEKKVENYKISKNIFNAVKLDELPAPMPTYDQKLLNNIHQPIINKQTPTKKNKQSIKEKQLSPNQISDYIEKELKNLSLNSTPKGLKLK